MDADHFAAGDAGSMIEHGIQHRDIGTFLCKVRNWGSPEVMQPPGRQPNYFLVKFALDPVPAGNCCRRLTVSA